MIEASVAHICKADTSALINVQSSWPLSGLKLQRAEINVICTLSSCKILLPGEEKATVVPTVWKVGATALAVALASKDQPTEPVKRTVTEKVWLRSGG